MILFSKSFIPTTREVPKGAEAKSHILALRAGLLFMASAGIYSYLPVGYRILKKIEAIIRKHMDASGAQEIFMSALQPLDIWKVTGRDKDLAEVMLTTKDRRGRDLCLGPTHEELITEIVKKNVFSYKQLPFILYQIQTKFRDEPRPRYGLVRSCEFMMKDAYSFDIDNGGLNDNYEKMFKAYHDIFNECGLDFVTTEADPGAMGGSVSHEFMVAADIGEDTLFFCKKCNSYFKDSEKCPKCKASLAETKMIEIGHIFKLGTKYSKAQEALFLDQNGERKPIIMGCYGIGVSRIIPAIIETNSDDKGIIWPKSVSPFDLSIVILDDKFLKEAAHLSDALEREGLSALIDDRPESAGVKFNDVALLGNPHTVIMGKKFDQTKKVDLEVRATGAKSQLTIEELINYLKKEYGK